MKYILEIGLFIIVLFLYLHIYYHIKVSNDLEVYSIQQPSKDKLEEVCNLRQPLYFEMSNEDIVQTCNLSYIDENYNPFDIKIRDTKSTDKDNLYLPVSLKEGIELFKKDEDSKYITEKNQDFLEETAMVKHFRYNDSFLRPPLVSNCKYDFMSGSKNSHTPLRYNLNYRNFFYVTSGTVKVLLIPPKNTKYLYENKDYENFEFRSPINPWNVQDNYKKDFEKIKSLELTLEKNTILFVPPYWWYSIQYQEISSVACFYYRTYMNTIAISPEIFINLLQQTNVKHEFLETSETGKSSTNTPIKSSSN
jgi:hypothetical protein